MAIVFPLPSPLQFGFAAVRWAVTTNSARARNPWTLADNIQVFDGQMWRGRLTVMPQLPDDGRRLAAWLAALDGVRGTFLLGDPGAAIPRGAAADNAGTPVADGAGQTGAALDVRGLPAGVTGYLLAGDYIQRGTGETARLHMVLDDVDSDGSGEAEIPVWPKLRGATTDGEAVVVSGAQGVFGLAGGNQGWDERDSLIYDGVTLEVEEVVGEP